MLCWKYLCSKHFCESDFTTAEKIHLNRVAVPCVSDSTSHSVPEPSVPSLRTPYLDSLPSLLTPEDDHVLPPTRSYSKRSLTSVPLTPTPVHAESPSIFSQIPALPSITSISQHLCSRRNLHYLRLCTCKCFWWGTQAHQMSKFFLEA